MLLLATGSEPRRLPLPGADTDGVLYLRKVGDSDRIRDTFAAASRVLIIGAGWIGLEVAAAARLADVQVTILEAAELPLLQVLGPQVALAFAGLHREHGVDLRLGVRVAEITAAHLRPRHLRGRRHRQRVPPAAGQAHPGRAPGQRAAPAGNRRGGHARPRRRLRPGAVLLHRPVRPGHGIRRLRVPGGYDRVVFRGDPGKREFIAFRLSGGRVAAGMDVNIRDVNDAIGALIRSAQPVDPDRLADPAVPLEEDVATGSLGQGLPYGVGIALAGRRLDKLPYQVWVLCGDSEMAEGSMWEALDKAAYFKLGNLNANIDVNRLGQRGPTELEWDMDAYRRRAEAFGCTAVVIDGHDITQIDQALAAARDAERPVVVLARTVKGKGFAEIEDKNGRHGRPLPAESAEQAVAALGGRRSLRVTLHRPDRHDAARQPGLLAVTLPRYEVGDRVATRKAYGDALVALGARPEVVALDREVGNSTYAGQFAVAVGLAVRGYVPFASTFAAFLSRGYDFLRMAGVSGANIKLCGSHAGEEIGPDGRPRWRWRTSPRCAIHGSTVLYPADATTAAALTAQMAATPGIVYLRATRGAWPVLYPAGEAFPVGGSKVLLRAASGDDVTPIGAGAVLEALAGTGLPLRVRQCAVSGLPGSGIRRN